jgi:hypothetical protein
MNGPEFLVKDPTDAHRLGFIRVETGKNAGGVWVHYYRPDIKDPIGQVFIDSASWASVLAHCSAAPHDGDTYAVAQDFHEGRIAPGEVGSKP